MKVLIIDSEARRQRQLRTILGALGHRAADIESADGDESGLRSLRAKRFDVCFLWVDCRTADTPAALREIRDCKGTKCVPVIAVGAQPNKDMILRIVQAGATAFLTYPFSAGDVEAVLGFAWT